MHLRRLAPIGALVFLLSTVWPADVAGVGYPGSMAATGDSITRAFNTGWLPFTDNPAASWSTGNDSRVSSHYLRLVALHPAIQGNARNVARSGANMADLPAQMANAADRGAQYVTVLMGANDVCTSTEGGMTSVAAFEGQFTDAMDTITSQAPSTRVYVVSIPDIHRLWSLFKDDPVARFVWAVLGICQSLLARPLSTDQDDVDRRARVRQRNIDFNAVLGAVCAEYRRCRFDGGAVFNTHFARSNVSTRDYFHPSISGEARLARVTWRAGYWGG